MNILLRCCSMEILTLGLLTLKLVEKIYEELTSCRIDIFSFLFHWCKQTIFKHIYFSYFYVAILNIIFVTTKYFSNYFQYLRRELNSQSKSLHPKCSRFTYLRTEVYLHSTVGTQRIELCSKDFQSSAMSPDLPNTHIDLFASLPASPSISQGQ